MKLTVHDENCEEVDHKAVEESVEISLDGYLSQKLREVVDNGDTDVIIETLDNIEEAAEDDEAAAIRDFIGTIESMCEPVVEVDDGE